MFLSAPAHLVILLVAFLSYPCYSGLHIGIDSSIPPTAITWLFGGSYPPIYASPGDTLVFAWNATRPHDVILGKEAHDTCNGAVGEGVYPIANVFTGNIPITKRHLGKTLYYMCSVGTHCSAGNMKAEVHVVRSCGYFKKARKCPKEYCKWNSIRKVCVKTKKLA